jgi:DNA-binding NtrC family response regulator
MSPARILIVEDDPGAAAELSSCLVDSGYEVAVSEPGTQALERLHGESFDLAVADQESIETEEFLRQFLAERPDLSVILLSGFGTVESAVQAMRQGAFDYLSKPVMDDELLCSVERALAQRRLLEENKDLKARLERRNGSQQIIGGSERMQEILDTVDSVAPTRATILLTGESGTGKTRIARRIHDMSPRAKGQFVEVNCGALPDTLLESELFGHARGAFTGAVRDKAGKFEEADGGTIFLDEIGTASMPLQIKLLRVLQDRLLERVGETRTREVDVRLILATNSDLEQKVQDGSFREDLFYRINVVNIELPPLRERQEDIPFLLEHFMNRFAAMHDKPVEGFGPNALDQLLAHEWPGNIRELENAIERAVVLSRGTVIEARDLPTALSSEERPVVEFRGSEILPLKIALEEPEKRIIERALELCGWNRQKTADMLEVNRSTLFHKMKKYGLMPQRGA